MIKPVLGIEVTSDGLKLVPNGPYYNAKNRIRKHNLRVCAKQNANREPRRPIRAEGITPTKETIQ